MNSVTKNWRLLAALMIAACIKGEKPDVTVLQRIQDASLSHSEVMEHAFWLSEVYGPRVTGSPNFRAAGNWAGERLRAYGIDVHEESFPEFGDGWWCDHFEMSLVTPTFGAIYAAPVAWSNPTPGKIVGEVMRVSMPRSPSDFDSFVAKYHGQIRSRLLLVDPAQPLPFAEETSGRRLSDNDLADLRQEERGPGPGGRPEQTPGNTPPAAPQNPRPSDRRGPPPLLKFMHDEGVSALVSLAGPRGSINNSGIFTVMAATFGPENHPVDVPPMIVMAREHYDRLARLVEHGVRTTVELDSSTHFRSQTRDAFNLIGEIRGNMKPEEVVMVGAHLDSWAGGTGATDNAAGCAVIIEAFRILKDLGVRTDRTLRLALWGGEEMGLMGSSIYVKQQQQFTWSGTAAGAERARQPVGGGNVLR